MLIEGNALKIRTIRSILVKSGDIGQNFRTLSFSERCFDTQTKFESFEKILPKRLDTIIRLFAHMKNQVYDHFLCYTWSVW